MLSACFVFALPAYATYKALARADPDALRPLAAYWAVLGVFLAFEQSIGLLFSWLPMYWELRTLFLLYIALPQTQGAVFVYSSCLEPWCARYEADIDATLASARSNALAFCRARITALLDFVTKSTSDARLNNLWSAYAPAAFVPSASRDEHPR